MFKKIAAILALSTLLAYSAVKFPYPQRKSYGNGTNNVVNSSADADLKNKWQQYLTNFYVEGTCKDNTACARIKFFDPDKTSDADYTVSEGIGYAMIMAVYFSDATTSYENQFKKLWAYYQKNVNGNGVMNWKIKGWNEVNQQNGATDAELDVVLALLMARYQFDNAQYETDANTLASKILSLEVSSDGLLKPGDAWDTDRNPSYVAPAVFELFKGQSNTWSTVLSRNYTFLKNNQNSSTGLPSDWADNSGNAKQCTACGYSGTNYGQDAVRAPWRWAMANAWFGHADAKTLINKLGPWVNQQTPASVGGPISLSGTMGSNKNSSYIGSLMCALTNNSSHQSKLNSFFSTMMTQTGSADASYFNQSMLLLTGLLVSGNMPNLKACQAGNCGTSMPAPIDPGDGNSTPLDRLSAAGQDTEDNRSLSALWEAWYAYTDKEAGYENGSPANGQAKSSITNEKFTAKDENNNCAEIQSYRVVLQGTGSDNDWAVRIPSYTLDRGEYTYEPFVGLGLDSRKNGTAYQLSSCTGGFSYQYKGSAHKFKVLSTTIAEGSGKDHYKNITAASTSSWTTVSVPTDELAQPTWVDAADQVAFNLSKVRGWSWELVGLSKKDDGPNKEGLSAKTGSLAIKNFKCLGNMTLPTYTPPKCGNSTPPAEGSSSSGGGSGGSSSSRGGNSSSSGGNSPIVSLPQLVTSNGVFAIKNGINLQVSKTAKLEVFSLSGKSVRKHDFTNGSYSITLGDLPKGLYIVKIQFGNQKEILRVPVR